ncbi:MAG TPA: energy transducer TonB [Bacteroidales bacterium]|nr:energy transducer TonB [Bacteroidales bacterium]
MKHQQDKQHKPKKFLKMPVFPGGKKSFREFVAANLQYPEEALKYGIQGTVYLDYTVDNIGTIENIAVTRGVGYGCDEEAVRLVKMLSYPPVRNRGVKMKVTMKTRIAFTLPAPQIEKGESTASFKINYTSPKVLPTEKVEKPQNNSYGYTITIGPQKADS